MDYVDIPLRSLRPDTLRRVVEEFVCREGTDYGTIEFSLEDKVAAVIQQLEKGEAILAFDQRSQSCTIMTADQFLEARIHTTPDL
ncbi:MAG: YheU family protein [Pseudobacteriovorax sp.]|nr:YheU family protein [Pseudobacteriovorax sp.]